MLDAREVEREENRLRDLVGALPVEQRKQFYERLRGRGRDPDTYAVLNWFLLAGLHHFYIGRHARGAVNLAVFLLGVLLLLTPLMPLGVVLIAGIFVVELWALFRSQVVVRDYNNRVTRALLEEMGLV